MLRVLLVLWLCLAGLTATAARAEFAPPGLGNDTDTYVNTLLSKAPPQPQPANRDKALRDARAAVARGDFPKAVAGFEQAITLGADGPALWMELSEAWTGGAKPNRERALQAAYQAYRIAADGEEQAAPLWRLGVLLDESFDRPEQALRALRELADTGQGRSDQFLAQSFPTLKERIAATRQRVGLNVRRVSVDTGQSMARVCVAFTDALSARRGVRFEDFVAVEPAVPLAASPAGEELCLTGFAFGSSYKLTLRQGLPGEEGLALRQDDARTVRIGDRPPSVAFRGDAFILPRGEADGIPVAAVNVDAVALKVYRINDRGLPGLLRNQQFLGGLTPYEGQEIADDMGELVWEGRMDVPAAARNAENVVALPFRQAVKEPQPGIYIVTAEAADVPDHEIPYVRATQWVLVSDIGLTAMEGKDGLTVFARSFGTAKPMAGVKLALVARNNAELARVRTDGEGRARFAPGLMKGAGGRQPVAVMAYAGADYAVLQLLSAAFDLSDRGVGGRPVPGPMDAFLYSDRGVYRQGETVNLSVLLRDDRTVGVEGLPLTLTILRPSGTEYRRVVVTPDAGGGAAFALKLSTTAPLGGWTVEARTDPGAEPVGTLTFQVDDFVPERLAVDLTPAAPFLTPGTPMEVLAKSRFLYGPPAAGLDGSAELALQPDPDPYPRHTGYRFGLVQERVTTRVERLEFPTTDANGESRITATLPPLPDTTRPLRTEIRVAVAEPGGRPSRQTVTVPVRTQPFAIGVKPRHNGDRLAEGQPAVFDVLAVGQDGAPIAKPGLAWELFREETTFNWYYRDGRYNFRATTRDRSVSAGTLDAAAGGPAELALGPVTYGRYRIEIADKATGVATSVRFASGWQPATEATDAPDKLEITADRPAYKPGDTARIRIAPPFAGEVLLTVASDRLFDSRSFSVPAEGATVDVPVDGAWGPGAYVTATVYRPPVKGRERQPVRAIGLVWLGIDPADRTLTVTAEAPELVRPRQPLPVTLRVAHTGAAEPTFVTLAAVDEGILRLTDFASPDPAAHYFGKRRLGIDIRDDYGRLIDAMDGNFGRLRQGGDASSVGLPVVPFRVVSLFHGPVQVGADGTARVTLDIPDFNGELRLMAVAWSKTRVGSTARALTVRDPLVADAALPRFLAPGDDSRVTLNLHAVDSPAGSYAIAVTGQGPVAVDQGSFTVDLQAGERRTVVLPLRGLGAGIGRVTLAATGPGGVNVSHDYDITVRPSRPVETVFTTQQMAPGATASFGAPLLASYVPGTAALSVTYSAGPPFDLVGLLRALDRYPFGCLEQTVSRAMPLLSVRELESAIGVSKADGTLDARLDQAIARTLDRQRYDGSFGLWSAGSDTDAWVTAYAMEFLARARAKGRDIPEKPFRDGLDWLRRHAVDGGTDNPALASRAYALHVLALAGVVTPSPARYFADAFLGKLPTPLAKAQVGAALARLGDTERANRAFTAATTRLARDPWHEDYGSTVRDAAALVTLLAEVDALDTRLPTLVDRLPANETSVKLTSPQEQAWLVLAAETLMKGAAPPRVTVGGRPRGGDPVSLLPTSADLAAGISVANAGTAPVWQAVSVSGVPADPRPAAWEGLRVKRNFLTRGGEPLNLDTIRQNDVFVILLEGEASTKLHHQAIVTHPLPAGWEIESVNAGDLPWIGELSFTRTVEARDDRYVAAFDLTEEQRTFRLAYLVRAVTPGSYELPGAMLEDMYKPRFFARQGVGRITVHPAQ